MKRSLSRTRSSSPLNGKTILLGLTGSIAIYKSCDLVRRLRDEEAKIFCLMSKGAQEFISPLTFNALSGNVVATSMWDRNVWKMAHLDLASKADLFIIAPASANCIARLSCGMADDIVTTTACATKAPVLIAPAMHETMWLHPATQSNVKRLQSYGYFFVGPERGAFAQGTSGLGRLANIQSIIASAKKILTKPR